MTNCINSSISIKIIVLLLLVTFLSGLANSIKVGMKHQIILLFENSIRAYCFALHSSSQINQIILCNEEEYILVTTSPWNMACVA